jgi:hypothetical protein
MSNINADIQVPIMIERGFWDRFTEAAMRVNIKPTELLVIALLLAMKNPERFVSEAKRLKSMDQLDQ